ncbi:MAG: protein translocase subunit SecF [Deltaproteobacteria bacterium]|nr:MAG: protein translocase subunit SecF [Deltaproteobacteria bacterium]TMQ15424.1 MAG: protein translocase subunit SecF [Deltaproteobacteria bacterium]
MTDHHKFRYLLPPGNNFAFVAKFRIWIIISILLMTASVALLFINRSVRGEYMNWTIDFKGGTQIHFTFKNKTSHDYIKVDPAKVRDALGKIGEEGFDVSEIDVEGHDGIIVRTPRFSALKPEAEIKAADEFQKKFTNSDISKASWSGDRLLVRSKKKITAAEAAPVFAAAGLELKVWTPEDAERFGTPDEATGEFKQEFAMWGVDRQIQQALEKQLDNTEIIVANSYGVGAKAGDKLRDDATKSIIYAIFLIMLYLAFRFDIRYAPGAAFATIHDAVMVIGVFAVAWEPVSLTSVAGLLTVMGYSVNDTVIVFDRIRENQAKLKDKKIERIIDISINEMLVRTILTSSTVFATTLIMNIFGTGEVKNFAFAMNIGVIVGTYSSIFLAAPLFMYISRRWYSGPAPARRRPAPVPLSESAEPAESPDPAPASSSDE